MAKPLVPDALWDRLRVLFPPAKPRRSRHPGRKPLGDRPALTGILFVLKTGIPWEDLPCEMHCGSGMTCWRRLQSWRRSGVWARLHKVLLAYLPEADQIDWSRAILDNDKRGRSSEGPNGDRETGADRRPARGPPNAAPGRGGSASGWSRRGAGGTAHARRG